MDAVENVPAMNGGLRRWERSTGHGVGRHHEHARLHPGHDPSEPNRPGPLATFVHRGLRGHLDESTGAVWWPVRPWSRGGRLEHRRSVASAAARPVPASDPSSSSGRATVAATWSLVAAAVLGAPAQASVAPDPLPLAGYIAPFTIGHRNLAVASPETAWLFPSRAVLYITSDGGASWDRFPSSLPPGSPAAAKETSRSSVRLTGGSAPTASGSGRRRTGPTGIPSAHPDACGPACPSGRRAHRVLCCAALAAAGPGRRPPPPRRAERLRAPRTRSASANPRVCWGSATSAISSRSRTRVGERAISGVFRASGC